MERLKEDQKLQLVDESWIRTIAGDRIAESEELFKRHNYHISSYYTKFDTALHRFLQKKGITMSEEFFQSATAFWEEASPRNTLDGKDWDRFLNFVEENLSKIERRKDNFRLLST